MSGSARSPDRQAGVPLFLMLSYNHSLVKTSYDVSFENPFSLIPCFPEIRGGTPTKKRLGASRAKTKEKQRISPLKAVQAAKIFCFTANHSGIKPAVPHAGSAGNIGKCIIDTSITEIATSIAIFASLTKFFCFSIFNFPQFLLII